jgi:hypothetical protein
MTKSKLIMRMLAFSFVAALTGCATTDLPPNNGPTASLVIPIIKGSLLGGYGGTAAIGFKNKSGCWNVGKPLRIGKTLKDRTIKIPANVGVLVFSTWREYTSACGVAGLIYPKKGHTYMLLTSHRVTHDTIYCYESVAQANSQGKLVPVRLHKMRVKRGFWTASYCPVENNSK